MDEYFGGLEGIFIYLGQEGEQCPHTLHSWHSMHKFLVAQYSHVPPSPSPGHGNRKE